MQTSYTYDPFGATMQSGATSANASQYTGRENDGTGLYYYRARYYSPGLQRFISEDPIGFSGGDANFYAYAFNNPTNFTDPSGLSAIEVLGDSGQFRLNLSLTKGVDNIQNALALAGLIPGLGEAADAIDGAISLARGDYEGAALAAASLAPIGGQAAGVARLARRANKARDVASAGGRSIPLPVLQNLCFVAGTLVHTREGAVPIEEVEVGDEVLSKNEQSGRVEYKRVTQTFVREAEEIIYVTIAGEETTPVGATAEHPFYVRRARSDTSGEEEYQEGEWVAAGELTASDLVQRPSGEWVEVLSIRKHAGRVKVYNFEVADNHNYFVGRLSTLVHNTCPVPLDDLSKAAGALDRGGLTKAGRALQKHGDRAGSVFPQLKGGPKVINFRRRRSAAPHADFAVGVFTPPLTRGNGVPSGLPYFLFGDPAAS